MSTQVIQTRQRYLIHGFLSIVAFILLVGCTISTAAPPAPFASAAPAWRDGLLIGQAWRIDPPAHGIMADGWLTAWASDDHLYTRAVDPAGTLGITNVLPPGRAPWRPTLLPAADNQWHLLWFDFDSLGDARLYGALLDPAGALLRGPVLLTPGRVTDAAIAPGDNGTVVLLWADDSPRPTLYGRQIDSQGRPDAGPPVLVTRHAEHPVLARTSTGMWVMGWLAFPDTAGTPSNQQQVTIRFTQSGIPWAETGVEHVIGTVQTTSLTEYIASVKIGLDQETIYLFVNHRDLDTARSWTDALRFSLTAGRSLSTLADIKFPAALPADHATQPTGFNTGPAFRTDSSAEHISAGWPAPAYGQFEVLPVAFTAEDWIMIGYFSRGELLSYQLLSRRSEALGAANLQADRNRHLTVTWANKSSGDGDMPAPLILTSTRSAPRNP